MSHVDSYSSSDDESRSRRRRKRSRNSRDSDDESDENERRESRSSNRNRDRREKTRSDKKEKKPKRDTNEKKVPFRNSYLIDLPSHITTALLQKNNIDGTYKDYQLKILLSKK